MTEEKSIVITKYGLRRTLEKIAIASYFLDWMLGIGNTLVLSNLGKGVTFLYLTPQTMLWLAQTGITITDYMGVPIILLWIYLYVTEKKFFSNNRS